ncbi:3-oxoacyl-[acyl-carrier-protein] synthase 2 [Pirellula sp. SH-Sr6A]|uniref:beta-ketoacyl-[acyl-carrier-protein] synthase family protein n=1 Tax=Pirellula sp. SH-Sr6A TaxID=1632865 RepID=UPI00078B3DD8|nr:beta-ketoacyl synthase N-terminal-like domain-containing protein [Pirellula sp. SH-Sr6A]AMV31859.1 3-oxoacyl-[acyl-carrier-protein] synthase 2 [Pirellula sp. SH-Sr6A]
MSSACSLLPDHQRVVITGLGVVSPLGRDLESFWKNISAGACGISQLDCLPQDSQTASFGGQAKCFTGDIGDFGPLDKALQRAIKKNQKVMCREIELGVAACQLALHHSGLSDPSLRQPDRTGIVFGSDYILTRPEEFADGVKACMDDHNQFPMPLWPGTGRPQVNPLWLLKYLPNMPASHVAIYNDLRGPSNSVTIREASSAASITEAVATIRRGSADVMLAGATGSRLEPLRALHFATSEKLADEADPTKMSRPFGKERSGGILGEGAGALVLESLAHAKARGAKIWGEIMGGAGSAVCAELHEAEIDSIRIATSNVLRSLMRKAEAAGANLAPEAWHIHACGKSEPDHDRSEALGIVDCVGESGPVVTAAKSYFGNLGAGSAAVEIVASCLALEHRELFGLVAPQNIDEACAIRPATAGVAPGDWFVSLSYSSQGQAAGVCVRRFVSA